MYDNTKGFHVKTFHHNHTDKRDQCTQDFLNKMAENHSENFTIISISNPSMVQGFATQVTYHIS